MVINLLTLIIYGGDFGRKCLGSIGTALGRL